jgi:uncharacterized OB-fold protein
MDKPQNLPPTGRTPIWEKVTEAAKNNEFILQVCGHCKVIQYPPRELCMDCLHDELVWENVSPKGELISHTSLGASTNTFFRDHLPRQLALVKLDCGPVIFAHLAYDEAKTGQRISILNRCDMSGEGVFVAIVELVDEPLQLKQLDLVLLPDNKKDQSGEN